MLTLEVSRGDFTFSFIIDRNGREGYTDGVKPSETYSSLYHDLVYWELDTTGDVAWA